MSKAYRPKNDIFCLLIKFIFPFWYLILRTRHGGDSIFAEKKSPEVGLKINCSVKPPWHRPSMGVAGSGLWAADDTDNTKHAESMFKMISQLSFASHSQHTVFRVISKVLYQTLDTLRSEKCDSKQKNWKTRFEAAAFLRHTFQVSKNLMNSWVNSNLKFAQTIW